MADFVEEAKKNWWFILMIILAGGLGWGYLKNRVETEPTEIVESVKLEQQLETETVTVPSKKEAEAVLGQGGVIESQLRSVGEVAARATVKAKTAEGTGEYYVGLTGNGFAAPEKGYFYEAWLVNPEGQYFSIGRVSVMPGGQAELTIKIAGEKREFTRIVVTLEPEDGDIAPAEVILEGNLTTTAVE